MIILYFIFGFLASVLGALPLGASNIAVINTTLKQNANQALKIAITAGVAEVFLSFYALHCNLIVKQFIDKNIWIQITIVIVLLGVGALLLAKKESNTKRNPNKLIRSKYLLGFLLGLLNPPVLIYWIVAISFINQNHLMLSLQSSLIVLFLFFTGIYVGKVFTLFLYSKFSLNLKSKISNINKKVNKITGMLLMVIALFQAVKLYAF